MPQCFGDTPWTITWMCSLAAPLDSCNASVSFSMIFGTDSSVTRCSYSLTSIKGISALLSPQDECADDNERQPELQAGRDAAAPVPAVEPVGREERRSPRASPRSRAEPSP